MKKNIKEPPTAMSKKQIFSCRVFIFISLLVLLLLKTFDRTSAEPFFERLSWLLNFNYITNSSLISVLNTEAIKPVIAVLYVLFLWLVATVLQKFYHSFSEEKAFGKTMVVSLIIANSALFLFYCSPTVFDRTGFMVLLIILTRFLFLQNKFYVVITPVLSVFCIMLQHKSFLTFYPAVFIISLLMINGTNWKKIVLAIDAAASLITFLKEYDFVLIEKGQSFLYSVMVSGAVLLPIIVFLVYIFIGAFSEKKDIRYLLFLAVPILSSSAACLIVTDTAAVFAESLISLTLIVVFGVIHGEKSLMKQVAKTIDLCQRQPILASALLFFEAVFLRVEPVYFGNIGSKIFEFFSF